MKDKSFYYLLSHFYNVLNYFIATIYVYLSSSIYLSVYAIFVYHLSVCTHVFAVWACTCLTVHVAVREQLVEMVPSFYLVGPRARTQAVSLGSRLSYPGSYLAGPLPVSYQQEFYCWTLNFLLSAFGDG